MPFLSSEFSSWLDCMAWLTIEVLVKLFDPPAALDLEETKGMSSTRLFQRLLCCAIILYAMFVPYNYVNWEN